MPAIRDHDGPADLPRSILAGPHPRGTRSPARRDPDPKRRRGRTTPPSWDESAVSPSKSVAAKPLVESASATALMDAGGAVKAVWMLRHYAGVARSNVSRFGVDNPYRDLQPIRSRDALDWRYKGITEETWETVIALLNRRLTPFDAAALFWWTRNQLVFRPATLGGRPDPDPPLRTCVQPARRGDPISFQPYRTGAAPRLDSPAGKGAAIPS